MKKFPIQFQDCSLQAWVGLYVKFLSLKSGKTSALTVNAYHAIQQLNRYAAL